MDTSRFKRREIQTRQNQHAGTGSALPQPRIAPAPAGSIDGFSIPVRRGAPAGFAAPARPQPAAQRAVPHISQQARIVPAPVTTPLQAVQSTPTPLPEYAPAPPRPAIDMALPGEESPGRQLWTKVRGKAGRGRRLAMRATAVGLVFLIAGGVFFSQGFWRARNVFKGGSASVAALQENVAPQLLRGEGDGRINVLLLGRGGGNHEAPDLTDTIMLASIDPVNKTSTLVSIPRDLYVQVPNAGPMKINAAFEAGQARYRSTNRNASDMKAVEAGLATTGQVVEDVLGVKVNYNVLINFKAFQDAVNAVGGVQVDVKEDLVDPTMAWENKRSPVLARAGVQTMNGKQALMYARSRMTSNDFARGERQRSLILALKQKVQTLGTLSNPVKMSGLLNSFGDNVLTDFSLQDIARFGTIVKQIENSSVSSISLANDTNGQVTTSNIDGQSVVLPKEGMYRYESIRNYVRSSLKDGYILKEGAKIKVLNGTNIEGLAGTKADELKSFGYNVVGTGNAPTKGYMQSVVVDLTGGQKKYTKNYLEQRFKVSASVSLPDPAIQSDGADFVIIVTE